MVTFEEFAHSKKTVETAELQAALIRAANSPWKESGQRNKELLYRAIVAIGELRQQVGIPSSGTSNDAVIELNQTAADIERHTGEQISAKLLEAADMIRTLRIVEASGVEISIRGSQSD